MDGTLSLRPQNKTTALRNRLILLAKLCVSVLLLAIVLAKADLAGFLVALKKTNINLFTIVLITQAINVIIRSLKWQLLLKAQNIHLSFTAVLNLNCMSLFFNNFFLGMLGGDMFRVFKTTRNSGDLGNSASSVVMERLTGFLAAGLLIAIFGIGYSFGHSRLMDSDTLAILLIFALLATFVMIIILILYTKYNRFIRLKRIAKLQKVFDDLMRCVLDYKNHKKIITAAFVYSIAFHICNSFTLYFLVKSANSDAPIAAMLFIAPLVALIVMVPVSISGIGVLEGSYVFYLQQLGLESASALLVAILARASLLIWSMVGGIVFVVQKQKKNPVLNVKPSHGPLP